MNQYSFKYEQIKLHKQKESKGHPMFEFPTKSTQRWRGRENLMMLEYAQLIQLLG